MKRIREGRESRQKPSRAKIIKGGDRGDIRRAQTAPYLMLRGLGGWVGWTGWGLLPRKNSKGPGAERIAAGIY